MELLQTSNLVQDGSPVRLEKMSGDGSDRVFYRIVFAERPPLIAVFPSATLARGAEEQEAAFNIGVHLHDRDVPVPAIAGYDKKSGLLLFEDLGNLNLQAAVRKAASFVEVELLYHQAIEGLILFQLRGARHFDPEFCWDTVRYDEHLMLSRESDYFRFSFCRDYLGRDVEDPQLILELQHIASRASREPAEYLLHRDFQSRNLLVHQGKVKIIDYQGARFGPLGYDLASLLIDPYAGLSGDAQDKLFHYYVDRISPQLPLDPQVFLTGYHALALQRNLQILGAFAFLSQVKGKIFFEQFIPPALGSLKVLLGKPRGKEYPALIKLADELDEQLHIMQFRRMDD